VHLPSNKLFTGGPWDGFPHHSTRLISCDLPDRWGSKTKACSFVRDQGLLSRQNFLIHVECAVCSFSFLICFVNREISIGQPKYLSDLSDLLNMLRYVFLIFHASCFS
jgi:hypothetical protein